MINDSSQFVIVMFGRKTEMFYLTKYSTHLIWLYGVRHTNRSTRITPGAIAVPPPSGWMQLNIFTQWCKGHFLRHSNPSQEKPVLVLDGRKTHTEIHTDIDAKIGTEKDTEINTEIHTEIHTEIDT